MKQKRSENNDAMSTGDLLGKLKKHFTDDTAEKGNTTPDATSDAFNDDLDIAALLKQYLPDTGNAENPAADSSAQEATTHKAEQANAAVDLPPLPEKDEMSAPAFDLDALIGDDDNGDLPSDEEVLGSEEPAVAAQDQSEASPAAKSGEYFAAMLDAIDSELSTDPMDDIHIDPTDATAGTPAPIRKYVYHFRPSVRNVGQTVKVQETIPQTIPPVPQAPVKDSYFADSAKPEFSLDDEPVIPDASAFDDFFPADSTQPEDASASVDPEAKSAETPQEEAKFDETDINLMIALGYEEELSKTVGIDKVNEIEKQLDSEVDDEDTRESAAFRGFEYTEKSQAKEIMQNYKTEYSSMLLRVFGTLVIAIALFLYENVSLFGIELPGGLNMQHYPTVHTLISLQLLVLAGALSWRQLLDGLKGAVILKPTPQSLSAVAVAVTVIYDLIIALVAPQGGVALYNFPAALCLTLLVVSDMMNLKREIYSFTIIADRREKYAVQAKLEPGSAPGEDALLLDIRRSAFIDHYFTRTNRKPVANSRLNYVLLPMVALAVALAIISFSTSKDGVEALNIFVLTILFCTPVSTLIACSYPLFRASQIAFEQDTAIIGETSVEEYSGAEIASFADKDVFPSYQVKLRSIKLYGNARPDLVLFAAASVFSKIGGPLDDVLELATKEFDRANKVELLRIAEDGIEANVDGCNVLVGRSEFLEAYNIYPLHDIEDDANTSGGARILYIVMDGILSAKLYIQYDMDVDFEFTLRELGREGIAARIRTYDPNIDDALIASKLHGKQYKVRVDKQMEEPSVPDTLARMDSGLVSRASAKSLIHTAVMCSRLTHIEHTGGIIRAISLAVSLLIMLFLTVLSSSVGISSVYVALYQIFWMIPALIITRLFIK